MQRRLFLVVTAAATFAPTGELMSAMRSSRSGELHELGLLVAVCAIRNGGVSSEVYVGKLLERASGHADFNAFISVRAAMTVFPGEIYHVPRSWAERR